LSSLPAVNGRMSSGTQFPGGDSSSSELKERTRATRKPAPARSDGDLTAASLPPSIASDAKEAQVVTWGKSPDGTGGPSTPHLPCNPHWLVFQVPHTYDVLSSIFNPKKPKTALDLLVLGVLLFQVVLFILCPPPIRRPTMLALFIFWRTAYDLGLGYLLHEQSVRRGLIAWVKDRAIFSPQHNPRRYTWIKTELCDKMGPDYNFEKVPVEFNTWLLFRRLVDLILVNDFVSYALFAIAFVQFPEGHGWAVHTLRWIAGWLVAIFNIWVKIDAHRVVKDFAWCMVTHGRCALTCRLGRLLLFGGSVVDF